MIVSHCAILTLKVGAKKQQQYTFSIRNNASPSRRDISNWTVNCTLAFTELVFHQKALV